MRPDTAAGQVWQAPEQDARMTLNEYYRLAVMDRGDAASRALGHAETRLSRNPGDRVALMYKGSLLTLIGEDILGPDKRREYIRTGLALMDSAAETTGIYPNTEFELGHVHMTTLAMVPAEHGREAEARVGLRALVQHPDFDRAHRFERVRTLALLSCLDKAAGAEAEARRHFIAARALDEDLAIRTFSAWTERASPPPDTST